MDWFHCNSCFIHPRNRSGRGKNYLLASCGHTYCESCVVSENGKYAKECKVCQKKITVFPLSGGQIDPDVQDYFKNPSDVLNNLLKISQFQKDHRDRLSTYMTALQSKYRSMKEEKIKVKGTTLALQKKLKELELENQALRRNSESPVRAVQFTDKANRSVSFNFSPSVQGSPFTSSQSFTLPQESQLSPSPRVWASRLTLPVRKPSPCTSGEVNRSFSHGVFMGSFK